MGVCYSFGKPPKTFWLMLALLALLFLMFGCKTVEYVPKVETKIEYRDRVERDTAFVRDSIYIHQKGDTVFQEKYKYIYKEHVKVDTSYIYKCDTVTVIRDVEKQLTRWEALKMRMGGYCMASLIFLLMVAIGYVAWKIFTR